MIHWFPGHMAKAMKQLQEKQKLADLFIVVLDARAPISSYNTEFDKIAPSKPRLFVITKTDLGDETKLDAIKGRFNHGSDAVIVANLKRKSSAKKILKVADKLLEDKRKRDLARGLMKPRLRAIVVGVPNSGKSTLINLLSSSNSAKVGNMPGVTRGQQWVNTGKIDLLDTPGILWPKMEDDLIGVKLAVIGSIKTDIIQPQEMFEEGYKLLSKFYPDKIKALGLEPAFNEKDIYSMRMQLCKNKNFLQKEGKPNLKKAHDFFINYLRDLKGVTYD